jgi:polar amino acid transport system permease protein
MRAWDHSLFLQVLTSPLLLHAAWVTVWVGTAAQAIGTAIGVAVAPMMLSKLRVLRFIAWLYLWIFRGTPLLAQILFFYAVLPQLGLRLDVLSTGLLALGINEGARMAEIVRAGLLSVPVEQREAAASLGLRGLLIFRLVVLPQAVRVIVPPLGNNYSYMLKATSLLSVISFSELLRTSQQLAQSTGRPLEIYVAAALWYLLILTIVTLLQRRLEKRLSRGLAERSSVRIAASPSRDAGMTVAANLEAAVTGAKPIMLSARNVSKRLGGTLVLDDVSLDVGTGEVVVIVGPSGSGKSTLLRCLNHLAPPDKGTVCLAGETVGVRHTADGQTVRLAEAAIDRQRQQIGLVFQNFNLFPHLTALRNVSLGPERVLGLPPAEAKTQGLRLLDRFGVADKADSYPAGLSGGQRQRIAIARSLAMRPRVLLFDEPTSSLDPEMVGEVLAAMQTLAAEGMTMIVVTHEMRFAEHVASRIVMMDAGRIVETGTPTQFFGSAKDPRTRAFLSKLQR